MQDSYRSLDININNDNIIIQADGECAQKDVVFVVDNARQVGIEGIAFVQEKE